MKPVVCICCGELISAMGDSVPSNPNLCQACSRIAEDTQDSTLIESAIPYELDEASKNAEAKTDEAQPKESKPKPADVRGQSHDS